MARAREDLLQDLRITDRANPATEGIAKEIGIQCRSHVSQRRETAATSNAGENEPPVAERRPDGLPISDRFQITE
jgi:hypothetical protein